MSLAQTSPQVNAVGFSPLTGHYLTLTDGSQVNISRCDYFRFLAGQTIEVDEPDYDAMADYQSALQMGYSFS